MSTLLLTQKQQRTRRRARPLVPWPLRPQVCEELIARSRRPSQKGPLVALIEARPNEPEPNEEPIVVLGPPLPTSRIHQPVPWPIRRRNAA
jgi:hypothetical protein